jgi:acetoin:2,6-dichlorophenolindophenol oxidoreductase subunit alpha
VEHVRLSRLADEDLRLMLLIRHFERCLLDLFSRGELAGTTHTCMGQEYVPVALRTLMTRHDYTFSNHRGHGHYLAMFEDPAGLLAEIMGKVDGVCGGVGGSQHLLRERYVSTGVQGESMPVAAGVALHIKRAEPSVIGCVYVGDGTWGEGAVYEALNIAQLWRLPLLVVVEHNGIAQSTPTALQMAGDIAGRAAAFGVAHLRTTSLDVNEIRCWAASAIEQVRAESLPLVLEFATHRIGPHSKGDDVRDPQARRQAESQDWYGLYERCFPDQFARLDLEQRLLVERVVYKTKAAMPSEPGTGWQAASA